MKNRPHQFLWTAIGIALSFLIAFGGWYLTSELFKSKESALLSAIGSIPVNAQTVPPAAKKGDVDILEDTPAMEYDKEDAAPRFSVMAEPEIFKVLQSWESDGYVQLHEPVEGQLSMEQAIDAGKAGLSYFYEKGVIPEEILLCNKTIAYLCNKQPGEQEKQSLSPYYSYWMITFSDENRSAELTINAATGEIWKALLTGVGNDEIDVEKALDAFISYLNLNGSGSYVTDGTAASKSFSNGQLHAVARTRTATTINEGGPQNARVLLLYLTTQGSGAL